jgi:hypothetical protein
MVTDSSELLRGYVADSTNAMIGSLERSGTLMTYGGSGGVFRVCFCCGEEGLSRKMTFNKHFLNRDVCIFCSRILRFGDFDRFKTLNECETRAEVLRWFCYDEKSAEVLAIKENNARISACLDSDVVQAKMEKLGSF